MGGGQISPRLFSAIKMSASKQATMKDSENYIVDFFAFSGSNEKDRFEGEINLRLSLAGRRMKNERRKQRGRVAKMEPFSAVIDRAWIKMDRTTRRASSRKVHQGRTSY